MHLMGSKGKLTVYPSFVLLICVLIWLDNGLTVLVFLVSAALHEGGHLLAIRLLRVPFYGMELRATGAVIHTGLQSPGKEAICTAAGPLTNAVLLLALFHRLPEVAFVNLLLLVYNLLPVYPLDGGRLLRLALCVLFGAEAGERTSEICSSALIVAAVICGVVMTCVLHLGLYPCLLAALFLCKLTITPCKMRRLRLK